MEGVYRTGSLAPHPIGGFYSIFWNIEGKRYRLSDRIGFLTPKGKKDLTFDIKNLYNTILEVDENNMKFYLNLTSTREASLEATLRKLRLSDRRYRMNKVSEVNMYTCASCGEGLSLKEWMEERCGFCDYSWWLKGSTRPVKWSIDQEEWDSYSDAEKIAWTEDAKLRGIEICL